MHYALILNDGDANALEYGASKQMAVSKALFAVDALHT